MPASSTAWPRALSFSTICDSAFAGDGGVDAAQRVVGAELDDDDVGLGGNGPFEPRQPVGGGVARHAGIDDGDVMAALLSGRASSCSGKDSPGPTP